MASKTGPNEPCPCQSGRKFKKCCGAAGAGHTQEDRTTAFSKLDAYIADAWEAEEEDAFVEFWGRLVDREDELSPELLHMSREVMAIWIAFDRELEDGRRLVDHFLE